MRKRERGLFIFIAVFLQISLMISFSFAFSFLISKEAGIVSATNHIPKDVLLDFAAKKSAVNNPSMAGGVNNLGFSHGDATFAWDNTRQVYVNKFNPTDTYLKAPPGAYDFVGSTSYAGYSGVKTPFANQPILANSPVWGHLVQGVLYAALVVGVIQLIGNLAGLDSGTTKSLSVAAFGGIMAGQLVKGVLIKNAGPGAAKAFFPGTKLTAGQAGFITGVIVMAAIFILTYKKQKKELINFQCLPWEPPVGGARCEECNKDPFRPCSEYRCKALGQACQLLNPGTKEEKCAWVNPKDVNSPTITPLESALKPIDMNLRYVPDTSVRPPALGVKIVSPSNECLPAFTGLQFGVATNEPAQCKIDYNHTSSFDEMKYYFGEDNYFDYNHTQKMRLPGPNTGAQGDLSPLLSNDGTFSLYVRCKDANGNFNVDEYAVNFCVDKSPDTTPPIIEEFSIPSGSFITNNKDRVEIDVYVNEPAECKWSKESKAYEEMENTMQCSTESFEINSDLAYTCTGNLTGIKNREENKFYFRCKDQPDKPENERNVMVQSKELVLKGSQPLDIISVSPNETIVGSTDIVPVSLELETSNGAEEGKAICFFSPSGIKDSYISMFETNSFTHKQSLNLPDGSYNYYFRCIDAGGNADEESTNFSVFVDKKAPQVTRAYREDALKIVTDEYAECRYSLTTCNYNFEEGLKMVYSNPDNKMSHFAEWKSSNTYHVKCQDSYGNQPDPSKCGIIVSAIELERNEKRV